MKHIAISEDWRSVRVGSRQPHFIGAVLSALAFNFFLFALPIAAAFALLIIGRDNLYAYEYSEAGSRAIAARVARLNGELIQLDFDRQNQWEDLVALELRVNDVHAARGFLLSGAGMLPARSANILNQADASDRELEVAAMQLLSASTRARYAEAIARPEPAAPASVGGIEDFTLMAQAIIAEPESDIVQFMLTAYSLGLAGELSPRMARGAAALLTASRREDFPPPLAADIQALMGESVRMSAFREAARAGANQDLTAAFRAAVTPAKAAEVRAMLDSIGMVSDATSHQGAAALLTHAEGLRDMPRLRLLAQAAGDRAAAAAKRLPRDGRLLAAARGELSINRDLTIALGAAAAAFAALVLMVVWRLWQSLAALLRNMRDDDDYAGDLVEIEIGRGFRGL